MEKTVNGVPVAELSEKLLHLFSMEDYSKNNKGNPFIKENIMKEKFTKLIGFNADFETVPVGTNNEHVLIKELDTKKTIIIGGKLTIRADDGSTVVSVTKLGTSNIKYKTDGSGIVSLENNIKAAETAAWKRCIMHFCLKPEGYENQENEQTKKAVSEATVKVLQAGQLLKNGMIKILVETINGKKQKFNIILNTDAAEKMAAKAKMAKEDFAASFAAETFYKVTGICEKWQGHNQMWVDTLVRLENNRQPQPQPQPQQQLDFCGYIEITSPVDLHEDGSATMTVQTDSGEYVLIYSPEQFAEMAANLRISTEDLAHQLKKGAKSNVEILGEIKGENLYFKGFSNGE